VWKNKRGEEMIEVLGMLLGAGAGILTWLFIMIKWG
jgi:hypothetical protein